MGNADSRLAYRQSVFRLFEEKNIPFAENEFWDKFFAIPNSMEEVFSLISPKDIRSTISKAPLNMKNLILKAVLRITEATANGGSSFDRTKSTLLSNAIRILIRILPFVFEDKSYNWSQEIFNQPLPNSTNEKTLAEELADTMYQLLFLPGFTLAPNVSKRKDGTYFIIWEAGIAAKVAPPSTVEIDTNRADSLKLLLVLMSPVLYLNTTELRVNGVSWINLFIKRCNPTIVMALLASLVNVVCSYDPIGFGVPYNYIVFSDTREPLVEASLQVLLVLMDYCYPLAADTATSGLHETVEGTENEMSEQDLATQATAASPADTSSSNIFQEYISRIHRKEDFAVLTAGLSRLMNSAVQSTVTYLPGSTKRVRFTNELVYFIWKFIELNKRYFSYLLRDAALLDILMPLLFFMSEARNDEGKMSVVHLVSFILLLLSGDRNFGVRLNKPYPQDFPALRLQSFEGNYADVLILCIHRVIVSGHRNLSMLYDCLLTIISNVAPYIKCISSVTSHKLLSLLRMFTAPKFLLANSTNADLSLILMDTLNNMIQYQFDGNTRLVYAILRQQPLFQAIHDLDLQTALSKLSVTSPSEGLDNQITPAEAAEVQPPKDAVPPTDQPAKEEPVQIEIEKQTSAAATSAPSVAPPAQRWVPTEEWIHHYKRRLPLQAIMRLLQVLVPQVEQVCKEMNINSEETVLKFLNSGTLVGLLPLPNPIMVRRYRPNAGTYVWASVTLWGSVYLANLDPPIWYGTQVALFIIRNID